METSAQVFNCFATGTRIATPDGDRTIETIKPGDLVLTHDGRAVPVIWRAWQSIVNPRNLSVGRGPVRIDAGALGPDLPNGPLTVTVDRDGRSRPAVRRHAGQCRHAGGGRNPGPLRAAFGDADALRLVACGA